MSTLADFVNAPTEIEFNGTTYRLRQPDLNEEGEFQRWLENQALHKIEMADKEILDDAKRDRARQSHFQDCAAGVYESGGEIYGKALISQTGMAKMLSIILRDEGVTPGIAKAMVKVKIREVLAVLISKVTSDPKVREAVLAKLGLPNDFFSRNSATPHSETPAASKPSEDSAPTNSCSASTSIDTKTAPPG
jgi:hypothetical protein